ncbi:hypothetical protein PLANPX_2264 [Lacipirellula parvula]|uniref:Uncharacterized protein n=1 Tax=Lacipirellula parvula TaxID=2650471 RepID=A0A5K7X9W4_9BACT|nr:hypothetical protein PLANPX_2264 [Lacipirellula parvula]
MQPETNKAAFHAVWKAAFLIGRLLLEFFLDWRTPTAFNLPARG